MLPGRAGPDLSTIDPWRRLLIVRVKRSPLPSRRYAPVSAKSSSATEVSSFDGG